MEIITIMFMYLTFSISLQILFEALDFLFQKELKCL